MASDSPKHPARAEWTVFGSRLLYASHWLNLELVEVQPPGGARFEHHVVRMQKVAVAVVLDESGESVLMLRRHRFIDGSWGWEVPVGIVEPGEEPAMTAVREVEEETGWRPRRLERRLAFQPAIGIADTPHEVYVGKGAHHVGPPTDVTEADEVSWIPIVRLLDMVDAGSIRDGATLVGVLHVLASGRNA